MLDALAEHIAEAVSQGGTPDEIAARACQMLRNSHGGRRHYVPSAGTDARDEQIVEARKAGATVREIAADVGCHPSTVSRVITRKNRSSTGFGTRDWVL